MSSATISISSSFIFPIPGTHVASTNGLLSSTITLVERPANTFVGCGCRGSGGELIGKGLQEAAIEGAKLGRNHQIPPLQRNAPNDSGALFQIRFRTKPQFLLAYR